MDLLKRDRAPILPDAWREIDEEARRVLRLNLGGRNVVDFEGPHGWDLAAVNRGRLRLFDIEPVEGVHAGVREVQPLFELRTPFQLRLMELDCITRGARDADLGPVIAAAERTALVEDTAIFQGFDEAGILGIVSASEHDAIPLGDGEDYPRSIVAAVETLRRAGVNGPYGLVLDARAYREIEKATDDGFPIRKRVEQVIEGPIVRSAAVRGGVLLSMRGGDSVLTVGQDLSIGYAHHDRSDVELYLTESFTFRVLEPAAAVPLRRAGEEP